MGLFKSKLEFVPTGTSVAVDGVYSLFDKVDSSFTRPFYFARTDGSVARQVVAQFNNERLRCEKMDPPRPFPDINDYILYKIGTWDDAKGELVPVFPPVAVPFNSKSDM